MSQTTYTVEAARAFAGMIADFDAATKRSISLASEETSDVAFGVPAVAGTDGEKQFLLPVDANSVFMGIVAHRHQTEDNAGTLASNAVAEGDVAEVVKQGTVWVLCATGCAIGDAVYWEHPPGTAGQWRNDATNAVQVTAARWESAAGVGELAKLTINIP